MSGALAELERELGAACERHAPLALEGAQLEATVRPRSAEECAAALGALSRARLGALVTGGGSRLSAANAPCRARVRLETTALREPPEIDLDEGVARFGAGEALASVAAQLAGSVWELPLDPPGEASTLGGALAAAALGPRFGHPRDVVLGLGFALASGERAKCGGRVVKNVTGYDLAKLLVGSNGSLAVITSAWLRLRARPERCEALLARAPADPSVALAAARAPTARVAALVDAPLAPELAAPLGGARAFVLELAGDAAAVAVDREALVAKLEARDAPAGAVALVRAVAGGGAVRARVAALPSEVAGVREALCAAGGHVLAFPARGLVYARFAQREQAFPAQLAAVAAAARRANGAWRLECAPPALRAGREVLGEPDGTLGLQRAVKRAYDPGAILNPGRGFGER